MSLKAPVLGSTEQRDLNPEIFSVDFNQAVVHEVVRLELNARRRGTASAKTRSDVRGGAAKPWRQKGTGRARQGSIRAPHWAGGGVVFGPSPRKYTFKLNRKVRKAALRSVLSLHAGRDTLAVLADGALKEPSTKQANELLAKWGQQSAVLIALTSLEQQAELKSFRNLPFVTVKQWQDIGVADIMAAKAFVVADQALGKFTELAANQKELEVA